MRMHHLEGDEVKKHKPKLKKLILGAEQLKLDIIKARSKLIIENALALSSPRNYRCRTRDPLTEAEIRAGLTVMDDPVELKKFIRKINRKPKVERG
jgi:hypothetical protein